MAKAGFRQADLHRALRVAKAEGFQITSMELDNGKITERTARRREPP